MNLNDKIALVTGSGRGIGRAIALKLANLGASVIVNDLHGSAYADGVTAEIKEKGAQSTTIFADIGSPADVDRLVKEAPSTYKKIDILVNNAGITRDGLILRMSDSDWDAVLSTNLKGAFLCTRAVLRHMLRQRSGRIINISSIAGIIGNAGQANYSSAKAGLIGLTKAIAKEVASRGITVNAIAPGFIDTEMTRKLGDEWQKEILSQIPIGHAGSVEDVAKAVAFLASDEAAYITGHVLNVDGGLAM